MLVQQEIGWRAIAPIRLTGATDDPRALLPDIPMRMIEQPQRRIDCPRPIALGDMQRHTDQGVAAEVERPTIGDLVDDERAKLFAAQARPERPLRGETRRWPVNGP